MVDKKEEGSKGFFISSTPWVGSPIILNLVVTGTEDGDEAIGVFRNFFKKDDLEISGIFPVEIVEAEVGKNVPKPS